MDDGLIRKETFDVIKHKKRKWEGYLEISLSCSEFIVKCMRIYRITNNSKLRSFQYMLLQCAIVTNNKKAMRLMAQLIKFYKFYYLLYLNKRWLNSQ